MSGVFDAIGTPRERGKMLLRKALEARREAFFAEHFGFYYNGAGDLLLQHGEFYEGRELPQQYAHLKGEPGRCFLNALDACEEDVNLRYCEGVYAIGTGAWTPHAWCLDPSGELLEVSLSTDPETIAIGVEARSGRPMLSLEHWSYWGAVFHPEFVRATFEAQDGLGVLDRPKSDLLESVPGMSVEEWREDWPVLRKPYDPDRRTQ